MSLRFSAKLVVIISLLTLSGCAAPVQSDTAAHESGPLIPMPLKRPLTDPPDKALIQTLTNYIETKNAPENTRYEITRIDLDGDGRREGIVNFVAPYHYWCSRHGCSLGIFKASDSGFTYMSQISPVQNPVLISESKTNGWRDIVVHITGNNLFEKSRNVALQFNGHGYPVSPAREDPLPKDTRPNGTSIFP